MFNVEGAARFLFKHSGKSLKRFSWCRIKRRKMHYINSNDMVSVSPADIRKSLRIHGYPVDDGFTCIATRCPVCHNNKTSAKESSQMYINKTTGYVICPVCDYSGQWSILEKVLKNPQILTKSSVDEMFSKNNPNYENKWQQLVQSTSLLTDMKDDQLNEKLEQFELPVFPDITKFVSEVRMSATGHSLYFPLYNIINKNVGYLQLKSGNVVHFVEPEYECSGLAWFKGVTRNISKELPLILVPTVSDALSIVAHKIQGNVACLPYGFNFLPQQVLPLFEKYSKLILWSGPEGIVYIRNFIRKLGESRCLLIRATDSQPSANEAFRKNLDIKSIIASARPVWHKSITTFKNLRQDVLSDLCNIEKVKGVKWQRYPILNKLLHGHRRGELTVLTGPTGCGKTTFCSEYSLDLAQQGVNTLWGSFEIRNVRLVKTMLQQFAGMSLEDNLDQFNKFADMFQSLPLYFLMFHGQQVIKDVMEAVEHACYVYDIAHVVIDNVQFMLGVGDEATKHSERFWKQDAVVGAFRTFATRRDCHVTLVMHPRKERDVDDLSTNSIFGSAKASQEADNVLIIQDKRLTSLRGKKYLQVAKNRYSGDLGIMPLEFDKDSLSYSIKKQKSE